MFYLAVLNSRLASLYKVNELSIEAPLEVSINNLRPPIFWKDKPKVIEQAKKWSLEKTKKMREKTYNFEVYIKSNSIVNKDLLVRKLIIDMCLLANA